LPRLIPLVARSLAVLALCAAAIATLFSLSGGSPSRARAATVGTTFPRPPMNNPITIPLHVGSDSLHLDDSRDYILVMPSQKKTGPLYIRGGHNVEVIGGYMSTTTKGPNINISDDSGTKSGRIVHIEGVLIDGSSGVSSDGIKIQAPNTIVQLENDRIVGLWGDAQRLPRRRRAAGRRGQGAAHRRPHRRQPLQRLLLPPRGQPAPAADRKGDDPKHQHVRVRQRQGHRSRDHDPRHLDRHPIEPAV
jgi:hypothetical protein